MLEGHGCVATMPQPTDNAASDVSFNELTARRAEQRNSCNSARDKASLSVQWRELLVQYTLFSAVIGANLQPQSELN
jgi:hypothetical protein